MTKEEIIKRADELDKEFKELDAERQHMLELINLIPLTESTRAEEMRHQIQRIQDSLEIRIVAWNHKCDELEHEVELLEAA